MKTLFTLIFFAVGATAFGQCNNGSLKGAYSIALSGVGKGDAGQINAQYIGRVDFDGAGKLTLNGIATLNNKSEPDGDTGEYQVSADCSFTGKTINGGGEINGIVTNGGSDHVILIRTTGITFSGGGSKIDGLASCSLASMNGGFGYSGQGPAKADDVGTLTFDGRGSVSGTFVGSVIGATATDQYTGTYELAANCLGKVQVKIGGNDVLLTIIPTQNGNGFSYQNVGPNGVITGSGLKLTR
jgi:hypothetical protein